MKSAVSFAILTLACLLFAGCTTMRSHNDEKNHQLGAARRFFVVRNLKDNHGLDVRIVRALRVRGLEAESGPITLLPASAQVVLTYEDRWSWDFSDHMVFLKISARAPDATLPHASASYQKQIGFSTRIDEVVAAVIRQLLGDKGE